MAERLWTPSGQSLDAKLDNLKESGIFPEGASSLYIIWKVSYSDSSRKLPIQTGKTRALITFAP
ncbi:MAG: hypothetical protein ABJA70_00790 [Chryseolinea sp.]